MQIIEDSGLKTPWSASYLKKGKPKKPTVREESKLAATAVVGTPADKTVMEIEDDEVAETTRDDFQPNFQAGDKRTAGKALECRAEDTSSKRQKVSD